jgi:hypothetical protein
MIPESLNTSTKVASRSSHCGTCRPGNRVDIFRFSGIPSKHVIGVTAYLDRQVYSVRNVE